MPISEDGKKSVLQDWNGRDREGGARTILGFLLGCLDGCAWSIFILSKVTIDLIYL